MKEFIVVAWPDSQDLMGLDGFRENSYLVNDDKGFEEFGSSAYFVNKEWYENAIKQLYSKDGCRCSCCNDNRFEIIGAAKKDLLKSTNIDSDPDEMKVIDNILFRCWQMGWLDKYDNSKNERS